MGPGAITVRERSAYIAFATVVFAYVVARAALVPLVHDEAASYLWFVQPGELIPFHAHWDANNHLVNTLCGWLGDRLFGTSLLALRWGNVLAFAVYALAAYRLGRHLQGPLVRWLCWAALLACPFALDLFSLFRGYGIGLAGLLFGLERIITYLGSHRATALWAAVVALVVAVYADLSLIPTVLVLVSIAALGTWPVLRRTRAQAASAWVALAVGGLASAYAVHLAWVMQRLGLLYHGSLAGFVHVTVGSLCRYVLGLAPPVLVWSVVVLGVAIAVMAVVVLVRRSNGTALLVVLCLVGAEVGGRIVLGRIFHVNYPEDRAGVHLVPPFVLLIALTSDGLAAYAPRARWLAALLLVLPVRTLFTLDLDHTLLWPEQSIPPRFIRAVVERQQRSARPLIVGGYHQLQLCWPLGARLQGLEVPPLTYEGFPAGAHDLRIVDERFRRSALRGYTVIDHTEGPGLWLLEREQPLPLEAADTTTVPGGPSTAEFNELVHPSLAALRGHELVVDLQGRFTCAYTGQELTVVTEVNDSTGHKVFYDAFCPPVLRAQWKGGLLHVARRIPCCPSASRAVVYVYDPKHLPYTLTAVRAVTLAVGR